MHIRCKKCNGTYIKRRKHVTGCDIGYIAGWFEVIAFFVLYVFIDGISGAPNRRGRKSQNRSSQKERSCLGCIIWNHSTVRIFSSSFRIICRKSYYDGNTYGYLFVDIWWNAADSYFFSSKPSTDFADSGGKSGNCHNNRSAHRHVYERSSRASGRQTSSPPWSWKGERLSWTSGNGSPSSYIGGFFLYHTDFLCIESDHWTGWRRDIGDDFYRASGGKRTSGGAGRIDS